MVESSQFKDVTLSDLKGKWYATVPPMSLGLGSDFALRVVLFFYPMYDAFPLSHTTVRSSYVPS